jgi:hypothetical protein
MNDDTFLTKSQVLASEIVHRPRRGAFLKLQVIRHFKNLVRSKFAIGVHYQVKICFIILT